MGVSVRALAPAPRRGEFVTRRLNGGLQYGFNYGLTAAELRDGGDFDLSEAGGISSRRALQPFTTCDLGQGVRSSWVWEDNTNHTHVFVVMDDGEIRVRTDTAACFSVSVFGTMTDANSRCIPHAWSAAGWLYVSDGQKVWRWGGIGFPTYQVVTSVLVHPLGSTDVTNLGVPPNCAAATYRDTVFIGNTLVYMTDPDAVWWSAPVAEQPAGEPLAGQLTGQEDFYESQRITFISGNQSDRINKLVAAGPTLYAFKRHSVHVLSTNGATVLTNDLSTSLGLAGAEAVAVMGSTVWFFDEHAGLHAISGNSLPESVFGPIFPLLDCGRIGHPEFIAVGYDGTKVFVSVCLDGAERNNVTFILNTAIQSTSKGGAWSRWDVGFDSFVRYEPQVGDSSLVGFCTSPHAAVRVNECSAEINDDFGFVTRRIATWFKTAFFDDGLPTLVKNWNRIALTVSGTERVRLRTIASCGPAVTVVAPTCDTPAPSPEQPSIRHAGQGIADVDLSPAEVGCFDPCLTLGIGICDTDSTGVTEDNGVVWCGGALGVEQISARVPRIASPGRGVSFAVEVRESGSTAAWSLDELDVKYTTTPEAC